MNPKPSTLRLAYLGDDFTGSTDALESLTLAGLRTALFLEPPSQAKLDALDEPLDAIGVSGLTRSLATEQMEGVLRPSFEALRALGPRHVHYKICSTFDSAPEVGSIGRAIEVGLDVFKQRWAPLLVGAPALGRYVVFGQLFARFGIGSGGAIHRLDENPAMMNHPVTPMRDAALLRHLAAQTELKSGLVSVLDFENDPRAALAAVLSDEQIRIVLFDGFTTAHVRKAGELIDERATPPWFSVGSSAVSSALAGPATTKPVWSDPGAVDALLVVSGSCSPVTAGQIAWAETNGWGIVEVAPNVADIFSAIPAATESINAGRSVVVCTSRGRSDSLVPSTELGTGLGYFTREVVGATGIRRVLFAGGDTSSYAGRALGIENLTMMAPLAPGAPLCRARGASLPTTNLEVNFKGGQVGAPDYFGAVRRGKL